VASDDSFAMPMTPPERKGKKRKLSAISPSTKFDRQFDQIQTSINSMLAANDDSHHFAMMLASQLCQLSLPMRVQAQTQIMGTLSGIINGPAASTSSVTLTKLTRPRTTTATTSTTDSTSLTETANVAGQLFQDTSDCYI